MSNFRLLLLASCVVSALLTGCVSEEITEYTVEKPLPPYRLLAAVVPHADKTWFIRMQGPRETMEQGKKTFDAFVESIRFTDSAESPIEWNKPEAWVESDEKMVRGFRRHAAFRIGSEPDDLEVVVTSLGGAGGSLLANVNRYRRQLGRSKLEERQLPYYVKKQMVGDVEVTRIDIDGSRPATPKAMPFHSSHHVSPPAMPIDGQPLMS